MVTPIPVQIRRFSSTIAAVLILSTAAFAESSVQAMPQDLVESGASFTQPQQLLSTPHDLAQAIPAANLSDLESGVLAEFNRLRTNPAAYADWLQQQRGYFNDTVLSLPGETPIQTREGIGALDEAIAVLQNRAPLPALTRIEGMSLAAQDHATDLGTTGRTSNVGLDSSTASDRLARYGTREGSAIELVSYGKNTPEAIVLLMVLGDGDPNRSHRDVLLSTNFGMTGIGCDRHTTQNIVCVMNYSTAYTNNTLAQSISQSEPDVTTDVPTSSTVPQPTQQPAQPPTESATQPSTLPSAEPSVEASIPATPPAQAAPTTTPTISAASDVANSVTLSELEQNIIAEVNLLRQNPAAYAEHLRELRSRYDGNVLVFSDQVRLATREGVAAVDEAIEDLENRYAGLPQLSPRTGLILAAQDHANDLNENDVSGHIGTDESEPRDRAERYGYWHSILGENISYVPEQLHNARWHVLQWLIDDGYASRGHRHTLLTPHYQVTGVSCIAHPSYGYVCVMNYADEYTNSEAVTISP